MTMKPERVAEAEAEAMKKINELFKLMKQLKAEEGIDFMEGAIFMLGQAAGRFGQAIIKTYGYMGRTEDQYGPADDK